ncbi:MAG: DNA translocase FtsK, partial [Planctomycetaceae bacterium]|nr:DNA translocase FtsK [Planctomycetaceae bacterium]
LMAGKTGSGKSTLLHIIITTLAFRYSPDEVEFYLIDFKKGVEFKDYATNNLPHARVIAVESDREFGVSALQHLDQELQRRGELFRKHGVQDIAGYRNETDKPLPRILLIIDEFQEFFVEDDKISQSASLLLDRLVRQGRAFGIHVILGSQTLGGAYTLARSTMGQIAVRVALQCSEADAHLILSEENTAARLLTRPGEAIYNDANGMMEGNHPFQIAWLNDAQRDGYLQQIQERLLRRGMDAEPAIVFEGNIPSDLIRNDQLSEQIDQFSSREKPVTHPTIWLGDSVEIAPPTALTFRHESGKNLLILGPDGDAAMGILSSSLVALASARTSGEEKTPSLYLLDGSYPDSDEAKVWKQIAETLPVGIVSVDGHQVGEMLGALTTERQRREDENERQAAPIFVLIHHLARFRDLRKGEDDYGLGGFGGSNVDKPVEPGKLFSDLLTKGPEYGIHFLIWCDSYNNADRWLSRNSLREMELRIALQMNASDSSNFIDSPAASRLGTHRALLYREETGMTEKFRPYGVPPLNWLETVRHRLQSGAGADVATSIEEFSIM